MLRILIKQMYQLKSVSVSNRNITAILLSDTETQFKLDGWKLEVEIDAMTCTEMNEWRYNFSQEILKCLKPKSVWIVNAIVPCSTIIILGKMLIGKTARICRKREKYFLGQSPYLNQCSLLLCSFHFWSLKRIIRNEWSKITTFLTRNFTNKVNQVRKFNKLLTLLHSSIPLF